MTHRSGRFRRTLWRGLPSRLSMLMALTLLIAGMASFMAPAPAAAQNINISLTKTLCADGFDDSGLSFMDLYTSCQTPGDSVPFGLVPDGGVPVGASADASGIVVFSGVAAGSGFLAETAAEMSYSRVFCAVYATGDQLPGFDAYTEVNATNNTIAWSLNDNESLDCFWFNIPEHAGAGSTVNVFKYACPDGVDLAGGSYLDYTGACTSAVADVEFYLYPSDNTEMMQLTDASGFAMFENVPSGPLSLLELPEEGSLPAAVFCATAPQGSGEAPDPQPVGLVDGVTIDFDLAENYYLSCFWFNAPDDTQGTVQLTKYTCPENYDWTNADISQLYDNCVDLLSGVRFFVGGPATEIEQVTNDNGQAAWQLDPGDYTLTETLPSGHIATRAYCGVNLEQGGGIDEMQVSQLSFAFSIAAGDVIDCAVFNLAGTIDPGPASLTINKYTCPAGFDLFADAADARVDCTLGTDDVNFALEGASTQMAASTGTGGAPSTVKFTDLESGVYQLTEESPEPIAMAFILSCSSDVRTFNYPFAPFAVIEEGGRIAVELLPGEDLACDWYNVLDDQPGTVTITKYWCDGDAGSLTNCQPFSGAISFSLIPVEGGEPIVLTTGGAAGTATVEALGTYELEEQGFTWCGAQSEFVDSAGFLVVESGADVTVDVYNCGPRPLQ